MPETVSDRLARHLDFRAIGDHRGWLAPLEEAKEIPFAVKRVYVIWATAEGVSRGFHAHRDLEQVVVCVAGRCRFEVDDGRSRREFVLDSPKRGLYLGSMIWREMHDFSSDCVLVVLASRLYDADDYIRDYEEFRRLTEGEGR
jgi:dTDP-4-dehydrorhamnose 3,5-epimerase-like enzyme